MQFLWKNRQTVSPFYKKCSRVWHQISYTIQELTIALNCQCLNQSCQKCMLGCNIRIILTSNCQLSEMYSRAWHLNSFLHQTVCVLIRAIRNICQVVISEVTLASICPCLNWSCQKGTLEYAIGSCLIISVLQCLNKDCPSQNINPHSFLVRAAQDKTCVHAVS